MPKTPVFYPPGLPTKTHTKDRPPRPLPVSPAASKLPLRKALIHISPVVIGYIPVSMAFGLMAAEMRLPFLAATLMSFLVYAGASQFVALGLIAAGSSPLVIAAATFAINLRHLLMSAAISVHFKKWPKWMRALFAAEMTDELFVLHSCRFRDPLISHQEKTDPRYIFTLNALGHLAWVSGTVMGYLAKSAVSETRGLGFDFALPGMLIALVVTQIKSRLELIVCGLSAVYGILFHLMGAGCWTLILGGIAGATSGVLLESWTHKHSA